jgi:Protein of unknown function (DUF1573)
VQTTSTSTSRPSDAARSRPNRDGRRWWRYRLGLRIIDFLLTLCLLGAIVFGIQRPDDGSLSNILPGRLGDERPGGSSDKNKVGNEGPGQPEGNGRHSIASLDVSPDSLNFGTVEVGTETRPQEVTLNSKGSKAIKLGEITVRGSYPADFESDRKCSGRFSRPDQKCAVWVTFSPSGGGSRSARLMIHSITGDTETVSLSGTGALGGTARASLSPPVMDAGTSVGKTVTGRFTFKNTGSGPLTIYNIMVSDEHGFFTITDDMCSDNSLDQGSSCSIEVTFTPAWDANSEGELAVKHDASGSPSTARLEGTTTLPPPGETTPSPSNTASQY